MTRKILKYIVYGIAWGWCWLVAICLIADLANFTPMRDAIYSHFPQNVLACTITGLGFGTSAIVYSFDRLRRWQQVLIHFGVGMGAYFPVAFLFGWIPANAPGVLLTFILLSVVVFFLIWFGFYLYYKYEAKRINAQLQVLNAEKK